MKQIAILSTKQRWQIELQLWFLWAWCNVLQFEKEVQRTSTWLVEVQIKLQIYGLSFPDHSNGFWPFSYVFLVSADAYVSTFLWIFTTQVQIISSTSQTESGSTPDDFVSNFILYSTVRIKIRDYFAPMILFNLKKTPPPIQACRANQVTCTVSSGNWWAIKKIINNWFY